jgi:hypothetical protein
VSYPINTIGDLSPAPASREVPLTTKLAIAGLVAGALLYMSPEYREWERKLSSVQKVGLALGGAGIFLAIMQIAMTKDRDRQMVSFQRGDGPVGPPPAPEGEST